ncbi:hypothetical protein, partial [Escherichia coli]
KIRREKKIQQLTVA